jgi:hypothetical protein
VLQRGRDAGLAPPPQVLALPVSGIGAFIGDEGMGKSAGLLVSTWSRGPHPGSTCGGGGGAGVPGMVAAAAIARWLPLAAAQHAVCTHPPPRPAVLAYVAARAVGSKWRAAVSCEIVNTLHTMNQAE